MADVMDAGEESVFESEDKTSGPGGKGKAGFENPLRNEAGANGTMSPRGSRSPKRMVHRESDLNNHDPDQVAKMRDLFAWFDLDGNGAIDAAELQEGLERHGVRISPVDSRSMLKSIDQAGTDGEINFEDFYDVMYRSGAATGDMTDVVHAFVGVRGTVTGSSKLILECEEDEEHLAKAAVGDGDDLFDILKQGLAAHAIETLGHANQAVDEAMEVFKVADADNNELLDPKELRKVVVAVMGVDHVTNTVFNDLFRQIDVDDSGDITVGEFKDWWELRMSEHSEVDIDPQAVAMRMMEQQSGMISPNSPFRQRWDVFQAFLLLYVAVSVPYRICFDDTAPVLGFWFFVDAVLDIYFVVDVFLNFRTAIVTRDGEVVYEHKAVALRYLRSWFPIDFISCLPFGYVHYVYPDTNNRAAKLFRLLKLLRLVRMKRILDRWEEELYSVGIVKLVKLVALITISAHWLSCGWYFVGCPLPDEEQVGWVVRSYGEEFRTTPKEVLYYDSAFWALMAVVMVGTEDKFGNRHPMLGSEKAMFAASFMVGAVVMSLIIGNMSDIIAHANPGATAQKEALGQVHTFLYERKLGGSLTRRVRNHFSIYFAERGTTIDMQSIFDRMPTNLQLDLAAGLRFIDDKKTGMQGCFSKVPFLSHLEFNDLIRIGCRMQHQHAHPPVMSEDGSVIAGYIMKEGERGNEMWIVVDGSVRVERKNDSGTALLGKLRVNEVFGELAVLVQQSPGHPFPRLRSAYAVSTSVLLSLSWSDMQELRRGSVSIDLAVREAVQIVQKIRPSLFDGSKQQLQLDPLETKVDAMDERLEKMQQQMAQMASNIDELKQCMSAK